MFTGIVQAVGSLASLTHKGSGATLSVLTPSSFRLHEQVSLGDSVANNGVCLTVTALEGETFWADISYETLNRSAFAFYQVGQPLNLELACTPSTHLGGHIMQGHVDGVGEIVRLTRHSEALDVFIRCPQELTRYMAPKGSIAVDGVSLTINDLEEDILRLTLIPHTQTKVNFEVWQVGYRVNLEADVLARYLERLLQAKSAEQSAQGEGVTLKSLLENGFL
ncbi:MAG: riboflavin synthase [Succinivibrio sp.]|nr:riboflavin synthase [Succinivibrio sp.]